MKSSELSGETLDYWVAKALGIETFRSEDGSSLLYAPHPSLARQKWVPSRFWSQAGPIIEQHKIELNWESEGNDEWTASMAPETICQGSSALEAAMRTFVENRLGSTVAESSN